MAVPGVALSGTWAALVDGRRKNELREFLHRKLRESHGGEILLSKLVPVIREEFDRRFDVRAYGYSRIIDFLLSETADFAVVANGRGCRTEALRLAVQEHSFEPPASAGANLGHPASSDPAAPAEPGVAPHPPEPGPAVPDQQQPHGAEPAQLYFEYDGDLEEDQMNVVDAVESYLWDTAPYPGYTLISDVGSYLAQIGVRLDPPKRVPGALKQLLRSQHRLFRVRGDTVGLNGLPRFEVPGAVVHPVFSEPPVDQAVAPVIAPASAPPPIPEDAPQNSPQAPQRPDELVAELEAALTQLSLAISRNPAWSAGLRASAAEQSPADLSAASARVAELERDVQLAGAKAAEAEANYRRLSAEHERTKRSLDELKRRHDKRDAALANPDRALRADLVEIKQMLKGDLKRIQAELDTRDQCVVCWERAREIVFLPCLHQVACATCSPPLRACPTCRTVVDRQLQPFCT